MYTGDFFKAAQYGVVIKRTALYDAFFAKLSSVCQLNYFKQCVFYNGVGKSG